MSSSAKLFHLPDKYSKRAITSGLNLQILVETSYRTIKKPSGILPSLEDLVYRDSEPLNEGFLNATGEFKKLTSTMQNAPEPSMA
jgi:hypothetical protein